MIDENLIRAYKAKRAGVYDIATTIPATRALERAREAIANGKVYYGNNWSWSPKSLINPAFAAYGERHMRWIENCKQLGWRKIGTAHEIARRNDRRMDHTGWYTRHDDQSETVCGVVYSLPARGGKRLLLAGYDDANTDGSLLSFDTFYEDEIEAARAADRIAERMAEEAREYDEAWQAGSRWADIGEEVKALRQDILGTIKEVKAAIAAKLDYPALCERLRADIKADLYNIKRLRGKRAKLMADFGRHDGFKEHIPA